MLFYKALLRKKGTALVSIREAKKHDQSVGCLQNLCWSFGLGPKDQASKSGKAVVVGSLSGEGQPAN